MKKNDLTKNTLLLSIGTILNKSLQFIMIPFFSAWLTTEDYGTFDVLCTYVALLIPIITIATSNAVFRYTIEANKEEKNKYITNGLLLDTFNLTILAVLMIAARLIFNWKLAIPFLFLAIGEIINNYLQGYLRGIKKLNIYSFCMAFSTVLIALCTTLFIKVLNLGLLGIILGYACGYVFGDIIIVFVTKYWKYFDIKCVSIDVIKEMSRYSFPLIFNDISWWIVNVSDRSIIKIFLGATSNGIYAIANKVPALCTSVFGVFSISWQQTASEMVDTKERNSYFNHVYNKSFAILLSLCIGVLSVNFILFDYIFASKYTFARFQAPILVFSIIFNTISQFIGGIQISLKRPKENGITTVISAIVNIIIHLSLIKVIGLYAASISTILSNFLLMILRKKRLKEVPLKLNNKNYLYLGIFIYFFICQYLFSDFLVLNIINIIIAIILFLKINNDLINKILKKVIEEYERREVE